MPLLLIPGNSGPVIVNPPTVVTNDPTSITSNSVIANGNITNNGGATITGRGIQFGTTPNPDRSVDESGSFSTGAFTESLTNLTEANAYYYRAYATNSAGTGYGSWVSFAVLANIYSILINGVDRTADVIAQSVTIEDVLNDRQTTCKFRLVDRRSLGFPANEQEVIITLDNGTRIFGGVIVKQTRESKRTGGQVIAQIECIDYVRVFDSNLVHKSYATGTLDSAIIKDIIATYCQGLGITTNNIIDGVTVNGFVANYLQPSQVMKKITDLTGRNWYIDYFKDMHYFPLFTSHAPFDITDTTPSNPATVFDLQISNDNSQLRNRVYVRGGTYLSNFVTYSTKGDGSKKQFVIPDIPNNLTATLNGVAQSVGTLNVDTSGFQWYLSSDQKYIQQDASGTILTSTDVLVLTYQYPIPVLVAVDNPTSIATNGVKEYVIFDNTITTNQAARDRASAELTDYGNQLIEGTFYTYTTGFRSGQYININSPAYGVNDTYIVQRVTATSIGGGVFRYQVDIASAKTLGIIRFLVELLEQQNNSITIATNEVVDNLLQVSDSLYSDSIVDALTIDSAGGYATWCPDSLTSSPTTRMRWDLFQWG